MSSRDDFSGRVKLALAIRAGHRCCFPGCGQLTASPRSDDDVKFAIVGHAAHITAAAPGGPRYDPGLSGEERSSASNGAWMCNNHGTLVDRDDSEYPAEAIRTWKADHERRIQEQVKLGIAADAYAQKRMLQRVESKIEEVRTTHRMLRNQLAFLETIDGHLGISTAPPAEYVRQAAEVRRDVDRDLLAWKANIEWLVSALGALGRSIGGDLSEQLGMAASSLLVYLDVTSRIATIALKRGSRSAELEASEDWQAAERESLRLVDASVTIGSSG